MNKMTFAVKIDKGIIDKLKRFCTSHGTKYSFFVEKAIEEKIMEENLKEDMLDFKKLKKNEISAVSFRDYLKKRNV